MTSRANPHYTIRQRRSSRDYREISIEAINSFHVGCVCRQHISACPGACGDDVGHVSRRATKREESTRRGLAVSWRARLFNTTAFRTTPPLRHLVLEGVAMRWTRSPLSRLPCDQDRPRLICLGVATWFLYDVYTSGEGYQQRKQLQKAKCVPSSWLVSMVASSSDWLAIRQQHPSLAPYSPFPPSSSFHCPTGAAIRNLTMTDMRWLKIRSHLQDPARHDVAENICTSQLRPSFQSSYLPPCR